MKTLHYLFIFLMFAILSSCNKEKLTKPTQTGANTFSCKINGKVYVAKTSLFSPGLTGGLGGAPGRYTFNVEAVVYNNKDNYTIGIIIGPNISEGIYPIGYGSVDHNNGYYTNYDPKPAAVNFTHIDYTQGIISGTFSFNAVNKKNTNDIIAVTDGRFDMKN